MGTSGYVRFFEEFGIDDVPLVGGKNASLGEMFQKLSGPGRPRPARVRHHRRGLSLHVGRGRRLGPSACRTRRPRPRRCRRAGAKSQARPGDRLRRRASRRSGRRDSGCLPHASAGVRRGGESRRAELGDRRGSADGELRRPTGFVPQHQGRGESARHVPPLLRQPLHRSRHPLPNRPGLRPLQGLAVDRRDEDGALRHLVVGCDVLPRHRVGLSRRRLRDGRLRPRRERGSRRRRPRRVLRPQADLSRRPPRGVAPPPRRQGGEDDPRRRRDEEHDAKHPHPEGRPRSLLPHR